MSVFRLKSKHMTGVPQFDDEHVQLVQIADLLRQQLIAPDGLIEARATFAILETHTRIHFENEERVMQQCGYPGFYTHREIHRNLLIQMEGMLRKLDHRRTFAAKSFNTSLAIWLIGHIVAEDIKLGEYLRAGR